MMRLVILLGLVALVVASPALAGPGRYCQPINGRDQIVKTGQTCPVGYLSSGSCCIALHSDSPRAFARLPGRSCPPGSFVSSSDYCVSLQ
ncbi:hypothetical protein ACVWVY_001967 [Bradyrhizobium sp. URHC0002]